MNLDPTQPILCFDFDGTLLDENENVHPADLTFLTEPQDYIRVASTGRTLESVRRVFAKNGLFVDQTIPFPMILMNGGAVFGFNEERVSDIHFTPKLLDKVTTNLPLEDDVTYLFMGLRESLLLTPTEYAVSACTRYELGYRYINNLDEINIPIIKVMAFSRNLNTLAVIDSTFKQYPVEGVYSMPTIYEITPQGINKGKGLHHLIEGLNLKPKMTIAAGDGGNDLPLLNEVDYAFAPHHASAEVLTQVQYRFEREPNGIFASILATMVEILS